MADFKFVKEKFV